MNKGDETLTGKTFFATTITLRVLTEAPIPESMELEDIVREADTGDYVLDASSETVTLTGQEMAAALYEAGSEPGFFMLDDEGNSTHDHE